VLVNVYLNLVLVPSLGFVGSAVATALTFAVLAWITGLRAREVFEVRFPWRRIFVPLAAAAALFAGALALAARPGTTQGTALGIKLAALVLWVLWSWFGGFLDGPERRALLDLLRGLRARREPPAAT
jgi:O-antigen/teichoic acid export membrane protein